VRLCKHLDFGTESFDASHDPGIKEIYFKDNGRQGRLARSLDGTWLFALAGQRYQNEFDDLASSVIRQFPSLWKE
jgi:hypothetical protein